MSVERPWLPLSIAHLLADPEVAKWLAGIAERTDALRTEMERHGHLAYENRVQTERAEKAEVELDTARTANEALIRERNTWARQMADVRGQRDDALDEATKATDARREVENDRDDLSLRLEDSEAALARCRELAERLRTDGDRQTAQRSYPQGVALRYAAIQLTAALDGDRAGQGGGE